MIPFNSSMHMPACETMVAESGSASRPSCTATIWVGQSEKLQYVVLNFDGTTKANLTLNINPANTHTASTHDTNLYAEDIFLSTGIVDQGILGVQSTSITITCTAQIVDAAATIPNGIDLHGTRDNPMPGTAE